MSGHNKWSQIKRQKAKTDGQKSKIFTKFAKIITQESKKNNGNINAPSLKSVIERARAENMTNESIERAIKKATTQVTDLENITYESYGPGGCAIVIDVLTENRNKAAQEVKHILSNHGFEFAGIGSATWAFEKTLDGWVPKMTVAISEEDGKILEAVLGELEENDEVKEVYTNAE